MTEWVKVLVSALGGVATGITTGILLEPLKQWILIRSSVPRVKRAIYQELGDIYMMLVLQKDGTPPEHFVNEMKNFKQDVFDYYYTSHREALYRVPEWRYLMGLYRFLKLLSESIKRNECKPEELQNRIKDEFEFHFSNGRVDGKLVKKYAKDIQRDYEAAIMQYRS